MEDDSEKQQKLYASIIKKIPHTRDAVSRAIKKLKQMIVIHAALIAVFTILIGITLIAVAVHFINSTYSFGMLVGTLTGILGTMTITISFPIYLSARARENERITPLINKLSALLNTL